MNQDQWTKVDQYINEALLPADPAAEAALRESAAAGLPHIQVAPNQGRLLMLLALVRGARRILEIGTLGGYSTIWLGRALPAGGKLISLELEPKHAKVAQANVARAGLSDRVEIRIGPALESLKQLVQQKPEPFDMVFIDADKERNPEYLTEALRMCRRGSVIVVDNVVFHGNIADAQTKSSAIQGTRRMHELIARNPALTATAIQMVGTKGYDGMTLAVVTGEPSI
jgi:predicted O-methyltransferase YrrM